VRLYLFMSLKTSFFFATIFASRKMNIVGSLCFCSECGSLLDLSAGTSTIKCDHCKAPYSTNGMSLIRRVTDMQKDFSTLEITTRSSAKSLPSALRAKRSAIQTKNNQEGPARAKVCTFNSVTNCFRSMKNAQIARTRK
jgi:LSD1 subclass zinc finger protein